MRKGQEIKTVSYVYVDNQPVRFDELTPEQKVAIATKLKMTYLHALFQGKAEFYVDNVKKALT